MVVEREIVDDTMTDNKNKSIKNNTREWEEDSDHNDDDDAIISVSKDPIHFLPQPKTTINK